jgi:hypothetical protein
VTPFCVDPTTLTVAILSCYNAIGGSWYRPLALPLETDAAPLRKVSVLVALLIAVLHTIPPCQGDIDI